LERLGAGGMGEVFSAEDLLLGRRVAIKFPSVEIEDGGKAGGFLMEARAASRLDHPNIARVYDYGAAPDGRPFLVMELVDGATLRQALRDGPLTPARGIEISASVLCALREAHRRGLVHRDIKPGNVMLTRDGDIKVLDFGLAKEILAVDSTTASPGATAAMCDSVPGVVRGTPEYMSPEQVRGLVLDHRTDLFSAGLLFYESITGRSPFAGGSRAEVMEKVIHLDPPLPSSLVAGVPGALDRIAAKALAKSPEQRYQTAGQMLQDLQSAAQPPAARFRLRPLWLAAGLAAIVLVAGLIAWRARPYRPSAPAMRWYQRGVVALRDGTYFRAARSLEKAVELSPDFALAHARLAEARNELDDAEGAREEMLRAVPLGGARRVSGVDALYIQAVHGALSRDFPAAIQTLIELAARVPESDRPAVLVDLGRAREKNRESPKAADAYRDAIRLDPHNAAAHLRLAVLLGRQQKPEAAAEFAAAETVYQAQGNTEGQVEVLYQRGLLASVSRQTLPDARRALERAIQLSRDISTEYQEIASTLQLSVVTYQEGDPARAEGIASEAVARARRAGMGSLEARGLTDLGNVQILKGDYARAEPNYRDALAAARRYRNTRAEARALYGLANLHESQGAAEMALQEIQPALDFYQRGGFRTESVQGLTIIARANRDLGRDLAALAAFERIVQLAGEADDRRQAATAEQGIASVLLRLHRLPEARRHYDRYYEIAVSMNDRSALGRSLMGRADVLWQLGRPADADNALNEAEPLTRDPAGAPLAPVLLQHRAEVALSRGAFGQAAAYARQSAEMSSVTVPAQAWGRCVAGLALARGGAGRAGKSLCSAGLSTAMSGTGYQWAVRDLRVALAEILLANGEPRSAAETIRPVLEGFAASESCEIAWRAWALAVRIYQRADEPEPARNAAARASACLEQLRATWSPADVNSYMSRVDLRPLVAIFQK
jgi:tetratricopeptide (TPR) repeat protein